jgi:hypothetical protein
VKKSRAVAVTGVAAALVALTATTAGTAAASASARPPQGPSSSATPYLLPSVAGATTTSILTVGDSVGGYRMAGIPDGLGAFDNGDGTFTLVANHELSAGLGAIRAHGANGAFVSRWVIDKRTLKVLSGSDQIQRVLDWQDGAWVPSTTQFSRFCSGDLAPVSAFYDDDSRLGTKDRIYLNGEETGAEGRAVAHVLTGKDAGTSYVLPWLGRFSWENAVAKPGYGKKTVVIGTDDSTPGQVYVYVGEKRRTGNAVERAGLVGGKVYGIKVDGIAKEVDDVTIAQGTQRAFSLVALGADGDVSGLTGAQLQADSAAKGVSEMARPEDSSWDPSDRRGLYVAMTNAFAAPSRLWHFEFDRSRDVLAGGTATVVVQGPADPAAGPHMLDNLTVNDRGQVLLQEDVGNNAYLGGVWRYDPADGSVVRVAQHDPARFVTGGASFLTQDEESSGIIPAPFLGKGAYLLDVQAHYATDAETVEGGQLVLLTLDEKKRRR